MRTEAALSYPRTPWLCPPLQGRRELHLHILHGSHSNLCGPICPILSTALQQQRKRTGMWYHAVIVLHAIHGSRHHVWCGF